MRAPRFDDKGNVLPPNIYRDKTFKNRKQPYFGQFMVDGKQRRTAYASTIELAEQLLKELMDDHGLAKDDYGRVRTNPEVENRLRVLEVALTNALTRIEAMERYKADDGYEEAKAELAAPMPDWLT